MNKLSQYASLVKFSHTIFALPFALITYVYALTSLDLQFEALLLVKILLCMVFARNAAMGFNRLIDRKFDAENPRTANREIPAGVISVSRARGFVIANVILFVLCAWWINNLSALLSPVALFVVLGYSYTKRFTSLAHIVLGIGLGIAPVGSYIAVTGEISLFSILIAILVASWVSGFDIIYSLQDRDFDLKKGLHSIPTRFSVVGSILISILLHIVSLGMVLWLGISFGLGTFYWIGAVLFGLVLIVQHCLARPSRLDRIGAGFGLINGLASVAFAIFLILALLS